MVRLQGNRISDYALASQNEEADGCKALGPKEGNPIAQGSEGGSKGHGVAEGRQGEDEATEDCDVAKLGLGGLM